MICKISEKQQAIKLRLQGKTYSEILEVVPVAKSTLSLWLREVGLSKAQDQIITDKKRASQIRGGARRREMRLSEIESFNLKGIDEVGKISDRDLFMLGIALYWAEGNKKSGKSPSVPVDFGNSDPAMLKLYLEWLRKFGKVKNEDFGLRLHLHINHKHREESIKSIWSKELGLPLSNFNKTLYKKHNPKTVRKKTGDSYIGLVSVRVGNVKLNRWIMGLIYAIVSSQK